MTHRAAIARRPTAARPRRRSRGDSLIEVLVALVLLALGFLAASRLQVEALRSSANAEYTAAAATAAGDLAARMWAADSATLPAADISAWRERLSSATGYGLPNADGSVVVSPANVARITVTWRHPRLPEGAQSRYVTDFIIAEP